MTKSERALTLLSGTDNNLAHANIGRPIDREHDGTRDCSQ